MEIASCFMHVFALFCKVLRDRLMVGHIPLEDVILVRVQVPQPVLTRLEKHGTVNSYKT